MKTSREVLVGDIYSNQSLLKWLVLLTSLIIGAGSILYTNGLVEKIRDRERRQIDLYAKTLEYLANESDSRNLIFILEEIVQANTTIPVILTDSEGNTEFYKNLSVADRLTEGEAKRIYLDQKIEEMREDHEPIQVRLVDENDQVYGTKFIYYENSKLLIQLQYYPYIQLLIIALFGLVTFAIFNYSRSSEQNRVWVGLAKETAHQLGTPLSSLMAWVEYFKSTYRDDENIEELNKDVERLEMITARFSSIGSSPQLKEENVYEVIRESVSYLQKRLSDKINFTIEAHPNKEIITQLNKDLFGWVMENLCKNAVDAMEGKGSIKIKILRINQGKIAIDVQDDGKGIPKAKINRVFKPGYSTKKRGWGLGLTLVQRIIENYHEGKISIKNTEVGKGTTFRITLNVTGS